MVNSVVSARTYKTRYYTSPSGLTIVYNHALERSALKTSTVTKTGVKNPNWKQQVKRVANATTPYSVVASNNPGIRGTATCSYDGTGLNLGKHFTEELGPYLFLDSGPSLPSNPSTSNLDSHARIGFLQKVRRARSAFQGGVFLGELREAIHMIVRPASAFRRGISSYSTAAKKAVRRAKNAKEAARVLSGTWLEAFLGWAPLLRDVDSGMAALATKSSVVPEVVQYTARDDSKPSIQGFQTAASGMQLRVIAKFVTMHRASIRYKGCVGWESSNIADTWQSKWGVSLRDFAPTVWELIPYSFLVDYFSNIGQIIDLVSMGTVSLRWGVKSNTSLGWYALGDYFAETIDPNLANVLAHAELAPSFLSQYSFTRSSVNSVSVGISDLHLRMPGVKDWRKWGNIAALATERALSPGRPKDPNGAYWRSFRRR